MVTLYLFGVQVCNCLDLGALSPAGGSSSEASSLSAAELQELLRTDVSLTDVPQSGVCSDAMLDRVLDRTWLANRWAGVEWSGPWSAGAEKSGCTWPLHALDLTCELVVLPAAPTTVWRLTVTCPHLRSTSCPFEASGVGYELIQRSRSGSPGLLQNIEGEGAGAKAELDDDMPALKVSVGCAGKGKVWM